MRKAEIERHEKRLAMRKQKLEEEANLADINATLLVNGVLIATEG
jgi:hypothetical protein